MSLPYFPMFPTDFEAKTSHLTLAEDGAYNRLLRLAWMTPGCSVPADRTWVYRRLRAQTETDQAVVEAVIGEFFTEENGRLSNAMLTREWLAANEAHARRKQAGAKGGKAKSLKAQENVPSNATPMLKQPEPEPEPEPIVERDKSLSRASVNETVESIWRVLPKRKRAGTSKPKLVKVVSRLLKAGKDPAAILTAVSRCYSEPRHTEEDGQYAPAVYTWLTDGVWENWLADTQPEPVSDIADDQWRRMLLAWHEARSWPPYAGPQPGTEGCRVPAPILERYRAWVAELNAKLGAAA